MLLLLLVNVVARKVVVRVISRGGMAPRGKSSLDLGAKGEVEAGTIACQPHQ